jgi:hypothetical protein
MVWRFLLKVVIQVGKTKAQNQAEAHKNKNSLRIQAAFVLETCVRAG